MADKLTPSPVLRSSLRRAFAEGSALAHPFWRAPTERRAWALLASVVMLTRDTVRLNLRFGISNNSFYNTLQNYDRAGNGQIIELARFAEQAGPDALQQLAGLTRTILWGSLRSPLWQRCCFCAQYGCRR